MVRRRSGRQRAGGETAGGIEGRRGHVLLAVRSRDPQRRQILLRVRRGGHTGPSRNAAPPHPGGPKRPEAAPHTTSPPRGSTRRTIATVGVLFFLGLVYFNIIDGALSGSPHYMSPFGVLLFSGGCFWWLFEAYGRNKWIGAVVGIALAIGILVGAAALVKRATIPTNPMEYAPELTALKKHHPDEYASIAKMLQGKIATGKKPEDLAVLMYPHLMPVVLQALRTTSDAALVEYARTRIAIFGDVAVKSPQDCQLLISGDIGEAGSAVVGRISGAISEEHKRAGSKAIVRVLEDEGTGAPPGKDDAKRSERIYNALEKKMKAKGFSTDSLADDTKTMEVRCASGIALLDEVMLLPAQDRSFMLRRLVGSE